MCFEVCPEGTYNAGNATCLPCTPPCSACSLLPTNCTSCVSGILVDYGVCVSTCASNQYLLGGVCQDCQYPCAKCFRAKDYCIGCPDGLVVSAGSCVLNCPLMQYYDAVSVTCQPCGQGCETCSSPLVCLTCSDHALTPRMGVCPSCAAPCSLCGHDNRCRQCRPGLLLFNGACLESCPANTASLSGLCLCSSGVLMHDRCENTCSDVFYNNNGACLLCH
jgi:proprotein convertase subtilisin/kexin type 5